MLFQTNGGYVLAVGSALASSEYTWSNGGCYGATYAIDGYSDYSNCRFFHSRYESYPWLAATMTAAQTVASVTIKSRCDASTIGGRSFTWTVRYYYNSY